MLKRPLRAECGAGRRQAVVDDAVPVGRYAPAEDPSVARVDDEGASRLGAEIDADDGWHQPRTSHSTPSTSHTPCSSARQSPYTPWMWLQLNAWMKASGVHENFAKACGQLS